jgi:hopanoid C-3 methylase HpnR
MVKTDQPPPSARMRVLFVHPSPLMYSEVFLRLEPLGLERVAAATRQAGHEVRIVDLQVGTHAELQREIAAFGPDAIGYGLNYLANVPEVLDLSQSVRGRRPRCFQFAGGHSVSFIAAHVLEQSRGGLDAVVRGDGEVTTPLMLAAVARGARAIELPGVVTVDGEAPGSPPMLTNIGQCPPARDLLRRRRRYFIGELDPCASIEFTRGCPWDCSFCSAWTFYGRAYRRVAPEVAAAELAAIEEPHAFIVDDVSFIKPDHGEAIAREVERRKIRKRYYLETRADVLLRNTAVFERWAALGLAYMFLGIEALDADGLELYRKRVSPDINLRALEAARHLGIQVAINLIVDPSWDEDRFALVREFALSVPEIVHLTVITPYPGTELWHGESKKLTTRDYRLFDIQHAVMPTTLPLPVFYEQLVHTQSVINRKFLGWRTAAGAARTIGGHLARGQTNFLRSLWKFSSVYDAARQYRDHQRPVRYELPLPAAADDAPPERRELYVHQRGAVTD